MLRGELDLAIDYLWEMRFRLSDRSMLQRLKQDPDLSPLRATDGFEALLASVERWLQG